MTTITFPDGRVVTRPDPQTIEEFLDMEAKWLKAYPPTPQSAQDQSAQDWRYEQVIKRLQPKKYPTTKGK